MTKVPVLFLIFNRDTLSVKAFESIREYKPQRVYIAADGPRTDVKDDYEKCNKTRSSILSMIDWGCEVNTLFRTNNLGCTDAVTEAISWFFKNEEGGVICEDDCLISLDFFRMCEELLPKYKYNKSIQQISAQNIGTTISIDNSYTFQKKPFIWGWATWADRWFNYMDKNMTAYPSFRYVKMLKYYGLFQTIMMYRYWNTVWKNKSNSSWDTFWHFAAFSHNLMSICPKVNLAKNIGCEVEGAHYKSGGKDPFENLEIGELKFPLDHPKNVSIDKKQVRADNRVFFRQRWIGVVNKLKS